MSLPADHQAPIPEKAEELDGATDVEVSSRRNSRTRTPSPVDRPATRISFSADRRISVNARPSAEHRISFTAVTNSDARISFSASPDTRRSLTGTRRASSGSPELRIALTTDPEKADVKPEVEPVPSEIVIPDGGLRAYANVFGGFLIAFSTFGFSSSFGVFEDYFVDAGAGSSSDISWIGSLQLFFLFSMGLPAGKLFDAGYFHHTLIFGSLLYLFCMFMLSLADPTKYYQLVLAQGFGIGIGSGLLLVPAISVQSHHWKKYRSLAMGGVIVGSSIGGVIYPIMLNQLFTNGVGFAWGVRAAAFMTMGLLFAANLLLSTRLPTGKNRPVGTGPPPKFSIIVKDLPYVLVCMGAFLGLWGLFLPYFYLELFVSSHGLSSTLAFYTIAILNAGSILGRTIPNWTADRIGPLNTLVPLGMICGGLVFVMFAATTPGAVIAFSILYGAFSGGFISLFPPTLGSMSKTQDEVGIRIGFGYFSASVAMLTGTPIDGALIGATDYQWYKAIIFSGVTILAGTTLLAIARSIQLKRKGHWKV